MTEMSTPSIYSLRFEKVTFGFDHEELLLKDASAELPTDEVVLIQGESGCGKSTLLAIMAGLRRPRSGSFWINDFELSEMSFEEFISLRLQIGYSFEYGGLLSNRTIAENLTLQLRYHDFGSEEEIEVRLHEMLDLFHLEKVSHLRPSSVSGGSRKAAVVARSLIMDPRLLLLDNPTVGLNTHQIENLCQYLIKKRSQGHLQHVFLVSEDEVLIESLATKKITMTQTHLGVGPLDEGSSSLKKGVA